MSGRLARAPLKFENETPIENPMGALLLLVRPWQENSERILRRRKAFPLHVEVAWYGGGYTKEEFSGAKNYLVADEVASTLLGLGYVRGTPEMGYTDMTALVITESGKKAAYEYRDEKMIRETIAAAEKANEWWYVCDNQTATRPACAFLMAPQSPKTYLHRGGDIIVRAQKVMKALNLDISALEVIFGVDESVKGDHLDSSDLPFERLGNCFLEVHERWTDLARLLGKKLVVFYDGERSCGPLKLEKVGEYLPNS